MRSNSSDVVVVHAMDCGSGGGVLAQLRADQCGGGVIKAAVGSCGDNRISMTAVWIWHRGGRPMRERRPTTMRRQRGVGGDGSGAVWEASASGDQTENFGLLTA
jgi:hypothetical protein